MNQTFCMDLQIINLEQKRQSRLKLHMPAMTNMEVLVLMKLQ